ncbi:DUF3616 domain-containing protein [Variovorax sp. HJSM1_2]|uniref:DUF3616 domain-containing protein n=1 Tax=Variovorax sp. HJSM1_2 TaxID=3366263 RepID=UPI003BCBB840
MATSKGIGSIRGRGVRSTVARMWNTLSPLLALLLWMLLPAHAWAQQPPLVGPATQLWDAAEGFEFAGSDKKVRKIRQSVSGVACAPSGAGQPVCLFALDEGSAASFAQLDPTGQKLLPLGQAVPLLGAATGELDAEGAATDGHFFYVTGSHSNKRSDCAANPDSRHVIRLRRDPSTGQALRSASGAFVNYADTGRLWDVMAQLPALRPLLGHCLGEDGAKAFGLNIEGLAVRGGRLYFGLRGPVQSGAAWVLAVDAEALFSASVDVKPTLYRLALGAHRGIRDMLAVDNGLLILAGPDDTDTRPAPDWTVVWWDAQPPGAGATEAAFGAAKSKVVALPVVSTPRTLATLDLRQVKKRACDKEVKPEAITLLQSDATHYRLLVLSDGLCDGGAQVFEVPREPPRR